MRLREFVNEESPILSGLARCKDLPEEVQRLACRVQIYRKYIIKLKKDEANDPTDAVDKDLTDRIYAMEAKIKNIKLKIGELNKNKVKTKRQSQQKTQQTGA